MAADPRFHPTAGPQPLDALLAVAGAEVAGPAAAARAGRVFIGVAPLTEAGPDEITYLELAKHGRLLAESRAGAVVLRAADAGLAPVGCIAIIAALPALAFSRIARAFHPAPQGSGSRHPSASIAACARIAEDVDIGAFAVIGAAAEIGPGCIIHPHAVIGPGVVLGADCIIHSHASISHALCGAAVVLHPGARVGQEGFGFTPTPDGRFVTMPQLGIVRLGDAVEVGANACIDRAALGETVIGRGTRIDNMVQVGHNVRTGQGCVLVAQVGISGSTVLEDWVTMAGQAGIAGHLRVGAKARIGAQAGVINNVPAGEDYLGSPAQPARQSLREMAMVRRLLAPKQSTASVRAAARAPKAVSEPAGETPGKPVSGTPGPVGGTPGKDH